ncbi:MAG: hypothetical protein OEX02_09380, partial [Cyclobacteriaceae bacterium]|nr:hypothetical protein [Cyclobacteriaceae bacterium]
RIYTTSYLNRVVTEGRLMGESWGYDVCTNISANFQGNALRILNGNPYNEHFRAYNADFLTTRRCCTGTARDCDSCYDTWERFSWIMINVKKHLANRQDFVHWLTTMYTFYMVNRFIVPHDAGAALRDIHALESEHVGIGVDAREEGNG